MKSGRRVRQFSGLGSLAATLALSPDGRQIAANSDRDIIIWDLESGRVETKLNFADMNLTDARNVGEGRFTSIAFSTDGRRLLFAGSFRSGVFLTPSSVDYIGGII